MSDSWDYIVVGGGSAGAVLGARLSEDSSASVLLIEAGLGGRSPMIQIPNAIHFSKRSPRYHWIMEVEPDPSRFNRTELLMCGRGLGGGSAINGMVFLKGLPIDYVGWAAKAGDEWGPAAVEAAFRKVGSSMLVRSPSPLHPVAQLFLESAHALGIPVASTELLESSCRAMPCPTNAAGGWRQSTARAYLRPVRHRRNLKVLTRTIAQRLILQGGRAKAVVAASNGRMETFHANEAIVLSAGAINTPLLLMHSGIGPADHLRSHGIAPIVDLPGVGEGLQDHPCVWIAHTVRQKTWNDALRPAGLAMAGLQWLLNRSGPAASGLAHAVLYGSSKGPGNIPDYEMCLVPAGYTMRGDGEDILAASSVTTAISLCRPTGRGSVRLRPGDTHGQPLIHYRLLDHPDEVAVMTAACRALREICNNPPLSGSILAEVSPGARIQSDSEWENYIRRHAINMCHPSGSCRMGSDEGSVVDARLRVRGVEGLHIADASVMPQITSFNTNAPTIMIGEKAAEFITRRELG